MKVLVVGSGGREHAIAWKLALNDTIEKIYCAPGNPGIDLLDKGQSVGIGVNDFEKLLEFVRNEHIDLTIVGPEDPLARGIVDFLERENHLVFGPSGAAAQLEASKQYAKAFMNKYNIPTAKHAVFESVDAAMSYLKKNGVPIVVKADGLAAGKGVTVARTMEEAQEAIQNAMVRKIFGDAGSRVVLEECLMGEEASILALTDGKTVKTLIASQDHKPAYDEDKGPNTGGMGAYAPPPLINDALLAEINEKVLQPCIKGMAEEGTPYKGVLYAGLMITRDGPKVIEFNCRFGDPETQVVLPLLQSDLLSLFVACCNGTLEQEDIVYKPGACVTIVMTSGGYPGNYQKGIPISGIDDAQQDERVMVFHAGTEMVENELVTAGGRVLNVTAWGDALPDTIVNAYEAVAKIHFDGVHYRTDIGKKAMLRLAHQEQKH